MNKLNIKALGLSLGIVGAVYMLFLGLAATYLNWGNSMLDVVSTLYIGYKATLAGSIIGAVWGFIDGFICGVLIAFFYNRFSK